MTETFSADCDEFEDQGNGVLLRWCEDGQIFWIKGMLHIERDDQSVIDAMTAVVGEIIEEWDPSKPHLSLVDVTNAVAVDYTAIDRVRRFNQMIPPNKFYGGIAVIVPSTALGHVISVAARFVFTVGWQKMKIRVFTDHQEGYRWLREML